MIELIGEGESKPVIATNNAVIFARADKLWTLVSPLIQSGQTLSGKAHFWVRWVVLAYFARQLRAFRAIVLLLEHGLVPEAQKILRPMIETHLHLDYIEKAADIPEVARMYLVWEFANDEKLLGFVKDREKVQHQELMATLDKSFADEKKQMGKDRWRSFIKQGPPMLSIDALARKQNFSDWYDSVYRRTSGPVHAINILTYCRPTEDGKTFSVTLAPSDKDLDITLDAAIALLLNAALRLDLLLELGKNRDLKDFDAEQTEWLKKRLGNTD